MLPSYLKRVRIGQRGAARGVVFRNRAGQFTTRNVWRVQNWEDGIARAVEARNAKNLYDMRGPNVDVFSEAKPATTSIDTVIANRGAPRYIDPTTGRRLRGGLREIYMRRAHRFGTSVRANLATAAGAAAALGNVATHGMTLYKNYKQGRTYENTGAVIIPSWLKKKPRRRDAIRTVKYTKNPTALNPRNAKFYKPVTGLVPAKVIAKPLTPAKKRPKTIYLPPSNMRVYGHKHGNEAYVAWWFKTHRRKHPRWRKRHWARDRRR